MKALIVLFLLTLLCSCGPADIGTVACHYESGNMQDITTGAYYQVDPIRCTLKSVDQPASVGCSTIASLSVSDKTNAPITLSLSVTQSAPKAGCLPMGQYQCQRYHDQDNVIYDCAANGQFRFKRF